LGNSILLALSIKRKSQPAMYKNGILGIDVGASGIKGAIVDVSTGELLSERFRVSTPQPSKTKAVAKAFATVTEHFKWKGSIGVGFPAIIKEGHSLTAANIDESWIGADVQTLFSEASGCPVVVCNDADAAGIAEINFGTGKGHEGLLLLITVGSGLGSALLMNGKLIPNTELGHLYLKGQKNVAEQYAADSARKREDLDWEEWGTRFNTYLKQIKVLFSPDMVILGGGASKKFEKFAHLLKVDMKVTPASLLNNAGIIGAALYAHQCKKVKKKVKV